MKRKSALGMRFVLSSWLCCVETGKSTEVNAQFVYHFEDAILSAINNIKSACVKWISTSKCCGTSVKRTMGRTVGIVLRKEWYPLEILGMMLKGEKRSKDRYQPD